MSSPIPNNRRSLSLETRSAEETRRLAVAISPLLRPGDVLVLAGDMGAGKTTFVQGLAVGLGIPDRVTSPTFVLMKEYLGGRYPLMHMDVYRLGRVQELIDLGFDEVVDPTAVLVVEWGDMVEPLLPPEHLLVELSHQDSDLHRGITLTAKGPAWELRMVTLQMLAEELFSAGRQADPGYLSPERRDRGRGEEMA